jgi:hypothetical protein
MSNDATAAILADIQKQNAAKSGALESPTPQARRVPMKRYYCTQKFSNIHVMMAPAVCEVFSFVNHQLDTDDSAVQAFLDPLVDKAGSTVVSKGRDQIEKEVNVAAVAAFEAAKVAHQRAVAAGLNTAL